MRLSVQLPANVSSGHPSSKMASASISVSIRNFYVLCFQVLDYFGLWFCVPIRIFDDFDHLSHFFRMICGAVVTKRYHFRSALFLLTDLCRATAEPGKIRVSLAHSKRAKCGPFDLHK